jgi:hypothetical protein
MSPHPAAFWKMLAAFAVLAVGFTSAARAQVQDPEIFIDAIVKNDLISGRVIGLTGVGQRTYRVVVFLLTDTWHIHPYSTGGENRSFATLADPDGRWQIPTVRRDVPADAVAALLVLADTEIPAKLENLRLIPHKALVIRKLRGSADYGAL